MRFLFAILVFCLCLFSTCKTSWAYSLSESEYQVAFTQFVSKYGKNYETPEFFARYNVFKMNLDKINAHNNQNDQSFTLAMNEFGDLTQDEFRAKHTGLTYKPKDVSSEHVPITDMSAVATSLDWRSTNNPKSTVAVTAVKNQGQCGSCWSFSTTGAVEGAWAASGHGLVSLSEQQLVDCSSSYGNQGCNGGLMDQAFQYIIAGNPLCTESAYPYTAQDGTCHSNTCQGVAKISSFQDVPSGNEAALMTFIQKGPVSIAIEADRSVFQFYSGGVLDSNACGTRLDHGVLLVGYGTDSTLGKDYWIVKNSWGSNWGENGYIRLVRNKNECGISLSASQPYV